MKTIIWVLLLGVFLGLEADASPTLDEIVCEELKEIEDEENEEEKFNKIIAMWNDGLKKQYKFNELFL